MQVTAEQCERVRKQAIRRFDDDDDLAQECVIQFWRLLQTDSALLARNPEAFAYHTAVGNVLRGDRTQSSKRPYGSKRDPLGRKLATCTIDDAGNDVKIPRYVDALECTATRPRPGSRQALCNDADGIGTPIVYSVMREADARERERKRNHDELCAALDELLA